MVIRSNLGSYFLLFVANSTLLVLFSLFLIKNMPVHCSWSDKAPVSKEEPVSNFRLNRFFYRGGLTDKL